MQQHSSSLAKQLVLSGNEVTLFHYVNKGDKKPSFEEVNKLFFNNELKFHNVVCFYFPHSVRFPGHYIYNSYRYSKLVYEKLKINLKTYDFIYSKGFAGWKSIIEKNKNKLPVKIGVKFHGYEMYQYAPSFKVKFQHLLLRPFVKMLSRNADYVFSYGGEITKIIKSIGVSESNIYEVSSAISRNWLAEKDLHINIPLRFLFVGRFERRKGIKEINEAISILSIKNISAEFHFMGPIPLKKQIKLNKIKTIYYGPISEEISKKEIYDSCDVLLCPSFSEGMPNVILEAMSRGLAIISSDVGSVSCLVDDKNGILINKITPYSIANAINKLNNNKDELIGMKSYSIKKIQEKFLWSSVITKLNLIINK